MGGVEGKRGCLVYDVEDEVKGDDAEDEQDHNRPNGHHDVTLKGGRHVTRGVQERRARAIAQGRLGLGSLGKHGEAAFLASRAPCATPRQGLDPAHTFHSQVDAAFQERLAWKPTTYIF